MSRIPEGRRPHPPLLVGWRWLGRIIIIFAFGIDQPAKAASLVNLAHCIQIFIETRCFKHHVFPPAGFDGLDQLIGLLQRPPHRRDRHRDVLAVLEHFEAMTRMTWRVGRDKHGFDAIVFDQFLERRIGLLAAACFCQPGTSVRNQIAHRNDFHVGMVLKAEGCPEPAYPITNSAHANPAIRNGFPIFRGIRVFRRFFKALNWLLLGADAAQLQARRPGDQPRAF